MDQFKENLKREIIEQLNLQHVKPEDIKDDMPLFGEGLGLDSIDALELIVLAQQKYGVKLTDPAEGPKVFHSVNTITDYLKAHQPK